MQITAEYLNELKQSLEAQRLQALTAMHKATGALTLIDALLKRLEDNPDPDEKEMPADDNGL